MSVPPALSVYYGPATAQALATLATFRAVIIQTTLYTPAELIQLRASGTRVLGYLSLGEDHPLGEWACVPGGAAFHLDMNAAWNSMVVDAGHPQWRETLLSRAAVALKDVDGLLLDTLDSAAAGATLELIKAVREQFPQAILVANRGFHMLPEVAKWVDGVLFEAFSTTHTPVYAPHDLAGLVYTAHWLDCLDSLALPVFALDYADTPELAAFARARAAELGQSTFVTTRSLCLPGGQP